VRSAAQVHITHSAPSSLRPPIVSPGGPRRRRSPNRRSNFAPMAASSRSPPCRPRGTHTRNIRAALSNRGPGQRHRSARRGTRDRARPDAGMPGTRRSSARRRSRRRRVSSVDQARISSAAPSLHDDAMGDHRLPMLAAGRAIPDDLSDIWSLPRPKRLAAVRRLKGRSSWRQTMPAEDA